MTPYQSIYGRFSIKVQDYTLDSMYNSSVTQYESYLLGLLKSSIPKFNKCKTSLSDRDDTNQIFSQTLTETEQEILAVLMQVEWAEKEVNNVLDIRPAFSDPDYKRYAESQNLLAKMKLRDTLIERVDKMMVDYSFDNYDFSVL